MATLALDLAHALDPVLLAEQAGIVPDPWQAAVLRSNARQTALLCARQTGKSTVTSLLALHEALYRPSALILLLSPSLRQSQELFRKVRDGYNALDQPCPVAAESALRLELANGSRVVCLPGRQATIRGFSGVSLLIEDEAAQCPDDLYMAIRPMLAVSGGRIVLLSTPFGKRGHFFTVWEDGGPDWQKVKITAEQCPRISKAFLESERAAMGDWWYRQEYGCEFVETLDQVFAFDDTMAMLSDEAVRPLFEVATRG